MTTGSKSKKSCTNCPSYGQPEDVINFFGKSVGAPVCLRYGKVLGKPGSKRSADLKIAEITASNCASHGKPRPSTPERQEFLVAFPDPTVDPGPSEEEKKRCTTCTSCSNFVRDRVVATSFGWPVPMCAAKGKLLMPNRLVHEARGCEQRRFGKSRDVDNGIKLFPEFEDGFGTRVIDPIKAYFKNKENPVDPGDYTTDKPVTDVDRQNGIQAWRGIEDISGYGETIYLPIYDTDWLPEDLRVLVPRTGDDEHPELYVDHQSLTYSVAAMWRELDETPAFWGEAGVGKTEFFRHMSWLMRLPFHRLSITGSTELDDLAGKMLYNAERGTYFQYGRLPKAWMAPGVIVLDEPNLGPPEVWQFIRPLTDNSKQLTLDMNRGERILRHDDSYLGMAMNPAWDPKNVGAMEIGDADANRLMHFHIQLPPVELEREIIMARVSLDGWEMPKEMLDMVMRVASDVRGLIANSTLAGTSWGIRPQIKVSRALRFFPPLTAYRMAIADALDPEQREAVLDQVRAQVSEDDIPWR